jgi:hypothetical protein
MLVMNSEELIRDAIKSDKTEGFQVIHQPRTNLAKVVEFDDLPRRKRSRKTPENIERWITADFVSYSARLFTARYKQDWGLNFSAQCQEMLVVRDWILERLGFCDNVVMRDFIKWFFDNCSDDFMKKFGQFYFAHMRRPKVMEAFINSYRYVPAKPEAPIPQKNSPSSKPKVAFNAKEMADIFILSEEQFILEYGILVSISWLIAKKKFSNVEAIKFVYTVCEGLHKKGKFGLVKEATEKYNPYPVDLLFLEAERFVKKIDPNLSIKITTTKNEVLDFTGLKVA